MMCKHEFEQFCIGRPTTWGLQTLRFADLCVFCGESRYETNLKQQLAAANARVVELEKERNNYLSFGQGGASFTDSQWLDKLASAEQRAEQAEAQCAAMRLRYEKYVRENCKLIRHNVADGIGKPDEVEGKCGGYCQNFDEPHYICQEGIAAYDPDDHYNDGSADAGTAILARMKRMEDALCYIATIDTTKKNRLTETYG